MPSQSSELLKHAAHDRLDRVEDIVLGDEAHLNIELVEFTRRAIGTGVFVPETRRDLEIAVETRNHQQLFELLGRLRKGVEFAGMEARRHKEVTCAFRARSGQDRGLVFGEPLLDHPAAQTRDDVAAQRHVLVKRFASQIEVAVLQADIFGIVRLSKNRQRQLFSSAFDHKRLSGKLHFTRREFRIHGLCVTGNELAGNRQDAFSGCALCFLVECRIWVHHNLSETVMVSQVDKQGSGMLPAAVQPAGQLDGFTNVGFAKLPTGMGAIGVHRISLRKGSVQ